MMALAGAIGIGLFVGIGVTLARAGPIALFLGYVIFGLSYMWPLNLMVGEMTTWLPIRGAIFELAARYVHPALGFCLGWTYFYAAVMLVCTEYSAVATLMQYWNTDVNPAVWIVMAMVVCYFLNIVAVRYVGDCIPSPQSRGPRVITFVRESATHTFAPLGGTESPSSSLAVPKFSSSLVWSPSLWCVILSTQHAKEIIG